MPQQIDEFQINLTEGLQDEAEELGIQLVLVDSQNDPAKQAGDMEDLIAQEVDLILVAPMDADAIVPSVEKANEAGIPVMTIDRGSNGGEILSHSAIDNYCFAYRGIEYAATLLNGGNKKILVLEGTPGMTVVNWNMDGANAAIEEFGFELAAMLHADWDTAKALAITEDVLTNHPDLGAIYCGYDSMTQGAVQALKAQGLAGDVIVTGGGYTEESKAMLEAGEMHGDIEFKNYDGARKTLKAAYEYLVNGVEPPAWTAWPLVMHTSDGQEYEVECPIEGWSP
jgi:ribose transport system substrate-binding protein